jgi:hypothetical protein
MKAALRRGVELLLASALLVNLLCNPQPNRGTKINKKGTRIHFDSCAFMAKAVKADP